MATATRSVGPVRRRYVRSAIHMARQCTRPAATSGDPAACGSVGSRRCVSVCRFCAPHWILIDSQRIRYTHRAKYFAPRRDWSDQTSPSQSRVNGVNLVAKRVTRTALKICVLVRIAGVGVSRKDDVCEVLVSQFGVSMTSAWTMSHRPPSTCPFAPLTYECETRVRQADAVSVRRRATKRSPLCEPSCGRATAILRRAPRSHRRRLRESSDA